MLLLITKFALKWWGFGSIFYIKYKIVCLRCKCYLNIMLPLQLYCGQDTCQFKHSYFLLSLLIVYLQYCDLWCVFQTRVLKSDFARYNVDDDEAEALDSDENGWKIIHTDVFRFPPHKNLFCAILGNVFKCYSSCSGKKNHIFPWLYW